MGAHRPGGRPRAASSTCLRPCRRSFAATGTAGRGTVSARGPCRCRQLVVAQVDGQPLQPRSLTQAWARIIGKTSLPTIRFHDLRHTRASQMLAAGVNPKIARNGLEFRRSPSRSICIRT
ncbi:tyrosine-type recombinase/integrase [Mesorhizobium yinganensis]|uniref:tyrosine-type recombinase/integrase n=1 Tax=Mesorhizobium yinganensis TaxID=3157707 RepID=UPI0032B79533